MLATMLIPARDKIPPVAVQATPIVPVAASEVIPAAPVVKPKQKKTKKPRTATLQQPPVNKGGEDLSLKP
jgi:hypothetical protein